MGDEKEQWYSNKDIFEMVQELKVQIGALTLEMQRTTILIRDYNGLREKVDACEKALMESHGKEEGKEQGSKNLWSYILGAVALITSLFSIFRHGGGN